MNREDHIKFQSENQLQVLRDLNITVWQLRSPTAKRISPQQEVMVRAVVASGGPISAMDELRERVRGCQACGLACSRTQTVFGVGSEQAKLFLVGEAPGQQEDLQGEPFVGRAGQLLDAMLDAIGLNRHEVYIANILKCRPPNNRNPNADEVEQCTPFLKEQLVQVKPKLIVALGRIAAHFLLNTTASLHSLRGRSFQYGEDHIPLVATYHPAYLLRSPEDKSKAYQDLLLMQRMLASE